MRYRDIVHPVYYMRYNTWKDVLSGYMPSYT